MAKRQLINPKMFNSNWTEKDEAILIDLLQRKIDELPFEIRKSDSPYVRARLRAKRKEYKSLLTRVERGNYDSNIIAQELASAKINQQTIDTKRANKAAKVGKYVDSYSDMNFDFQGYFRKSRYFGTALPIISLILTLAFTAMLLMSVFLPNETLITIDSILNGPADAEVIGPRLTISSIGYFKLDEDHDFRVYNNGKWPKGTFIHPEEALEYGEIYYDEDGEPTETVLLFADLGMESIDITVVDVLKAFFRTPMMSEIKIDAIENLEGMKGGTWYYNRFIRNREDELSIKRGENGKYDAIVIVQYFATYGTIFLLILAILACFIEIAFCIGRLFSYTTRRFHFMPLLIMLFTTFAMIAPAFADIGGLDSQTLSIHLKEYFNLNWEDFLQGAGMLNINALLLYATGIMSVVIVLPFLFKNRAKKAVTFVPKGNRPHARYNNKPIVASRSATKSAKANAKNAKLPTNSRQRAGNR